MIFGDAPSLLSRRASAYLAGESIVCTDTRVPLEWGMEPGDVFEERYRIEIQLGRGGQGNVYHAVETATGRHVAIKVHRGTNSVRFIREGRTVSKLKSRHAVKLYEFGRAATGNLFLVFEFVDGEDLATKLERDGGMDWQSASSVLLQLLDALAEAHELGILHRDIKPANVMLAPNGLSKLLDFGVAYVDSGGNRTSRPHTFVGTTRYVAPEILRGAEPTPRSDMFAVGLFAYELLVGVRANNEERGPKVVERQLSSQPFELPDTVDVPDDVREWVNRLLSIDPEQRPHDAGAALAELTLFDIGELPEFEFDDEEEEISRAFPSSSAVILSDPRLPRSVSDTPPSSPSIDRAPRQLASRGLDNAERAPAAVARRRQRFEFRWRYVAVAMVVAFLGAAYFIWRVIRGG